MPAESQLTDRRDPYDIEALGLDEREALRCPEQCLARDEHLSGSSMLGSSHCFGRMKVALAKRKEVLGCRGFVGAQCAEAAAKEAY